MVPYFTTSSKPRLQNNLQNHASIQFNSTHTHAPRSISATQKRQDREFESIYRGEGGGKIAICIHYTTPSHREKCTWSWLDYVCPLRCLIRKSSETADTRPYKHARACVTLFALSLQLSCAEAPIMWFAVGEGGIHGLLYLFEGSRAESRCR